ncbi:hypothetical protein [uncultured Ornithinimicrobium sp.]|uniref:hypothetical protein n=1 Tax=uncultured Ornithinimicrobium sp. TaxID=259307 RepID=UPI002591DB06|nr:hypothetical protein [uncultured Ornithinimicrobium sp.]
MPRYSPVTFNAQRVEQGEDVLGYVVSGFLTESQLATLRQLVDSDEYERSKKWRGAYQEMARAIVDGVDSALNE